MKQPRLFGYYCSVVISEKTCGSGGLCFRKGEKSFIFVCEKGHHTEIPNPGTSCPACGKKMDLHGLAPFS
jgi:hypothetical protein